MVLSQEPDHRGARRADGRDDPARAPGARGRHRRRGRHAHVPDRRARHGLRRDRRRHGELHARRRRGGLGRLRRDRREPDRPPGLPGRGPERGAPRPHRPRRGPRRAGGRRAQRLPRPAGVGPGRLARRRGGLRARHPGTQRRRQDHAAVGADGPAARRGRDPPGRARHRQAPVVVARPARDRAGAAGPPAVRRPDGRRQPAAGDVEPARRRPRVRRRRAVPGAARPARTPGRAPLRGRAAAGGDRPGAAAPARRSCSSTSRPRDSRRRSSRRSRPCSTGWSTRA